MGVAVLALTGATGCNWLTPFIFVGDHQQAVTAEFDKLAGSRIAIVTWTDAGVQYDYPHARLELSSYIADKLRTEMLSEETPTEVVSPREVEAYLQANPAVHADAERVGEHFNADYVIYVEILDLHVRDPEHPQLLRGTIEASVRVVDLNAQTLRERQYELAPVSVTYPETAPLMYDTNNAILVREATYRVFSEAVARKFYDHTIDM